MNLATEGVTDTAVARRICREVGLEVEAEYGQRGKHRLDSSLRGYNEAARHGKWFVLRDLDSDADCAPSLMGDLLPEPSHGMVFRIAVRQIETWLLADRIAFANFFSVPASRIGFQPESLPDPKRHLVALVRRSRSRTVRDDVVPLAGSGASMGPGYVNRIIEFAQGPWRPFEAGKVSDSLRRCIERLSRLRVT